MNHLKQFKQMLNEWQLDHAGGYTVKGWKFVESSVNSETVIGPEQPKGSTLRFYFNAEGRLLDMVPGR